MDTANVAIANLLMIISLLTLVLIAVCVFRIMEYYLRHLARDRQITRVRAHQTKLIVRA